jgi:hypothetical protein
VTDDKIRRAAEAKTVLDNELFKGAFDKVAAHIEAQAISCDPDNMERARRIILAKQILSSIHREFLRMIEDGLIEEVRIREIEKQNSFKRVFRR